MKTALLVTSLLLTLLTAAPASSQSLDAQRVEEAKAAFEPLDASDLEAARTELARTVIDAERLLRRTPHQGAGWMAYLKWNGLQKQLAPGSKPDARAARETLRLLGSGAEGLEKPEMQRVADAIEGYLGVASFAPAAADRQAKSFGAAVDGLAELLADDARIKTARGSYEAERRLALLAGLESTGVGSSLARQVRNRYGRPNLQLEVDSSLLNRLVARPVSDVAPINDTILGTRVRGTGQTSGSLSVSTLPSYDRARLAFCLTGATRTNTRGVNGPVSIHTLGTTSFSASKIVELSDRTFRVLPASAQTSTRSKTQSVKKIGGGLGSRIIEKIARQRVAEKKSQADAIASGKAKVRVEARLNEQLNSQITEARRRYDEGLSKPMRQRRATPRHLVQRTTSNSLIVEAVQADKGQLAAWDSATTTIEAPLAATLHQTAVNNLLDAYLGGATLSRGSVEEPTKIDIVTPPWLKLKAEKPAPGKEFQPWSLRLRGQRPVSVEFAVGKITAIIHAAEMKVEDKSYKNWDLIAVYRPVLAEGRWQLIREGDIDVLPSRFDPNSGKKLASGDVGLRNNLSKALNEEDRFPAQVTIDPIDLTSRGGPIKFLSMAGMRVDDGWLATGWRAL